MSVRVAVLGAGLVGLHFAVGLERIKEGELEPVGVPLARYRVEPRIEDLELAFYVDVDDSKVGRSVYDVARRELGGILPVPESLREVEIVRGIHLDSTRGLPLKARGIEERAGIDAAISVLADAFKAHRVDVVVNLITTEHGTRRGSEASHPLLSSRDRITASHAYAVAALEGPGNGRGVSFLNFIPTPLANDETLVREYAKKGSLILGDDGATGATPLTADLLEHLAERNRRVLSIAQFNIGGNTDFLALTDPGRNLMKELTKSSVVEDILGYDAPHFIKPTGYLEPLGDKKFVSMHIWWKTFNGLEDELVVNMRINDSPALAGLVVDAARISKALLERGYRGTIYEVNSFFMKKPGPSGSKNVSRIVAYYKLLELLRREEILRMN
ncbi:MAG: myo-inositol-1-phosphate synthase [Desulfurococcales archaeon]|nr:myo-inositol-1-phosphate synthase [Desulfurococcales archaeon]